MAHTHHNKSSTLAAAAAASNRYTAGGGQAKRAKSKQTAHATEALGNPCGMGEWIGTFFPTKVAWGD